MRAGHVFVWLKEHQSCAASHGELPAPVELEALLRARLAREDRDKTLTVEALSTAADVDRTLIGERGYRVLPLATSHSAGCQRVGALVIPDSSAVAVPPGAMMPIFSPDGRLIAFNDYGASQGRGLTVMDFDLAGRKVSNARVGKCSSDVPQCAKRSERWLQQEDCCEAHHMLVAGFCEPIIGPD